MTINQKRQASNHIETKKIIILQAAANVNMILNFGRNITDVAQQKGVQLHILFSRFQKNIVQEDLNATNAILHKSCFKQEFSIKGLAYNVKSLFEIYRLMKKLKPDVVYTRGSFMGYIGRTAAFFAGVKNIYHHQDDFFHREENIGKTKKYMSKKMDVLLSKISTKLFFVSETIVAEAKNLGISPSKCVQVGHDLHPIFKNNINLQIDGRHQLIENYIKNSNEVFIVGAITRIEDFKGIDTIINVAKRIKEIEKNIKFFIRGNGAKLEKYRVIIKSEQLTDTVFLVNDYLPSCDMPALFKSFDVFFLPTRREGFGMVFAEAMCMGVPVICPKIYPVIEVVPESLGWLINPEDIEGYVKSIFETYNNPTETSKRSLKAQKYAIKRWGGTQSGEKVVNTMLENTRLHNN